MIILTACGIVAENVFNENTKGWKVVDIPDKEPEYVTGVMKGTKTEPTITNDGTRHE